MDKKTDSSSSTQHSDLDNNSGITLKYKTKDSANDKDKASHKRTLNTKIEKILKKAKGKHKDKEKEKGKQPLPAIKPKVAGAKPTTASSSRAKRGIQARAPGPAPPPLKASTPVFSSTRAPAPLSALASALSPLSALASALSPLSALASALSPQPARAAPPKRQEPPLPFRVKHEDMSKYGSAPLNPGRMFSGPNSYSSRLHKEGYTAHGSLPCKMYTPGEPALKYYEMFE